MSEAIDLPAARRRRPALDRESAIDAVCEVIAVRGYENTRFADVAAHAGASIGSLQYLFGSRTEMIAVALEDRTLRFFAAAASRADSIADPIERLRWVATYLASGMGGDEAARLEWLVWTEYWRAALRDERLRSASVSAYASWVRLVRDCLELCVCAGVLREPADPEGVAVGLVALGDGLGIQISLGHRDLDWDRAGEVARGWIAGVLDCPALV